MKILIKELNSDGVYLIRHKVLRKGKPFETCFFDRDDDKTTKHFGFL